jgi:hypothetical protein
MVQALNLTAPLKQDAESQERLQRVLDTFDDSLRETVEAALSRSELVHYARFVVIDRKYIQVLTEFDGDFMQYTEFFRRELGPVFELVFSLAEGAPPWEEINNPNGFAEYAGSLNLPSIGSASAVTEGKGYLYSAVGDATVREIKACLSSKEPAAS